MTVQPRSQTLQQRLDAHNQGQRRYYQRALKPHMQPANASPYLHRHVDQLIRFGAIAQNHRLLEVGCGMGRYTLILAALGYRIEGIDLSPELLARLRAAAGDRQELTLHCADVANFPAGLAGHFDRVIGFFALHHMHDLPLCFSAMTRLLRPGGRVVFLEPNPFNPLYYVQMAITPDMTWAGDRGLVQMRRGRLFSAMESAGLTELSARRFGFLPPVLMNQPWGAPLESTLERMPAWRPFLPFQLFQGTAP